MFDRTSCAELWDLEPRQRLKLVCSHHAPAARSVASTAAENLRELVFAVYAHDRKTQ